MLDSCKDTSQPGNGAPVRWLRPRAVVWFCRRGWFVELFDKVLEFPVHVGVNELGSPDKERFGRVEFEWHEGFVSVAGVLPCGKELAIGMMFANDAFRCGHEPFDRGGKG